jgi:uncharacterized protein YjbI with pentapeptide repeats
LEDAILKGANLENAVLEQVKVSRKQLDTAKSLAGAVLPDGDGHK